LLQDGYNPTIDRLKDGQVFNKFSPKTSLGFLYLDHVSSKLITPALVTSSP